MVKTQRKKHSKNILPFIGAAALGIIIIVLIFFSFQEKAQLVPNKEQPALPEQERQSPSAQKGKLPLLEPEIKGRVVRIGEQEALDMDISAMVSYHVTILGREGFSHRGLTVNVGDEIAWKNNDAERKELTLVFQKPREVNKFITSSVIKPGTEWRYSFSQPGEYNYWTVGYGTKGKITVQ